MQLFGLLKQTAHGGTGTVQYISLIGNAYLQSRWDEALLALLVALPHFYFLFNGCLVG
jgi:hypothetical protein